jgi:hypothetical protein
MPAARSLIVPTLVGLSGVLLLLTGCPFAMGDDYMIVTDGGGVTPMVIRDADAGPTTVPTLSCPNCDTRCNVCIAGVCTPSPGVCETDGCNGKGCKQ